MKVVLDTNVIASAVLTSHGVCAKILDMFADGAESMGTTGLLRNTIVSCDVPREVQTERHLCAE